MKLLSTIIMLFLLTGCGSTTYDTPAVPATSDSGNAVVGPVTTSVKRGGIQKHKVKIGEKIFAAVEHLFIVLLSLSNTMTCNK